MPCSGKKGGGKGKKRKNVAAALAQLAAEAAKPAKAKLGVLGLECCMLDCSMTPAVSGLGIQVSGVPSQRLLAQSSTKPFLAEDKGPGHDPAACYNVLRPLLVSWSQELNLQAFIVVLISSAVCIVLSCSP